jgi:hypothetical protein
MASKKVSKRLLTGMIYLVSRPCHWNIVVVCQNTAIGNFSRCQNEIATH